MPPVNMTWERGRELTGRGAASGLALEVAGTGRTTGRCRTMRHRYPAPKPFQATHRRQRAQCCVHKLGAMAVANLRAHAACTSGRVARTACARRQTLQARCVPAGAIRAGALATGGAH